MSENQMIFGTETETEINSLQLNSSRVSSYLLNMVGTIETMASEGLLNEGNASSLAENCLQLATARARLSLIEDIWEAVFKANDIRYCFYYIDFRVFYASYLFALNVTKV